MLFDERDWKSVKRYSSNEQITLWVVIQIWMFIVQLLIQIFISVDSRKFNIKKKILTYEWG